MKEFIDPPLFLIFLIIIAALHFLASALSKRRLPALIITAVNAAAHIALTVYLLIEKSPPEKLFLALLISASAALLATRPGKRGEDKDGI